MKPSEYVKSKGLRSLVQISETTRISKQTLQNWFKNKPRLFKTVVYGVIYQMEKGKE